MFEIVNGAESLLALRWGMLTTRRRWFRWVTAAGFKCAAGAATLEIGRLLPSRTNSAAPGPDLKGDVCDRSYVVRATVTLLGVTVFSRNGVGEGYARYEVSPAAEGRSVVIEFGAGSFPEHAHGINKMGFIRESVMETAFGSRAGCAYFGFMTTSQEASLVDAKRLLDAAGETLTYSVSCGTVTRDGANNRTMLIRLPSRYGWRDRAAITREARTNLENAGPGDRVPRESAGVPATFLYAVRRAMLDPNDLTEERLIFNGKDFALRTDKRPDAAVGAELVRRNIARSADRVIRLNGMLQPGKGGARTGFRVWFESGSEQTPPLRFDYQARSFLRLAFETSGSNFAANGKFSRPVTNHKKENA
jgi:hypothetical protein